MKFLLAQRVPSEIVRIYYVNGDPMLIFFSSLSKVITSLVNAFIWQEINILKENFHTS